MKGGKNKKRILIVTGPSGGHIFPSLAFIEGLLEKDKNYEILLVLPKNRIGSTIKSNNFKVDYLPISSFRLNSGLKNLSAFLKFISGGLKSLYILLKFQPNLVVSFGTISSVPLVILAWLARKIIFIHEQNVLPGRANKFLAPFADKIAVSFLETAQIFTRYKNKIILTGNLLRREIKRVDKNEALAFFGLRQDKLTVLVMGGSQGSSRINLECFKLFSQYSAKAEIQVIHLCGVRDFNFLKNSYKRAHIDAKLFSFLESMSFAYEAADLAISRAGATSLAELIFYGIPAILIPYPFAYSHQSANAHVLEKTGACVVIPDARLDKGTLVEVFGELVRERDKLKVMRKNYENFRRHQSADLLIKEATDLLK